jgi:hypothetical protein
MTLVFTAVALALLVCLARASAAHQQRDAQSFGARVVRRAASSSPSATFLGQSVVSTLADDGAQRLKNGTGVSILADKLDSAAQSLRHSNWTVLMHDLHDPQTQPYISAVGMVLSLVVCFYGHRSLLVWLSLLGFITFFLFVYVFAPLVFPNDLCCEPAKQQTLLAISGVAGAVGAILAIWAFRVGLALAGGAAGLSLAMASRPILEALHLLNAETDFLAACAIFSAVGALCALLRPKPLVVLGTAVVGGFGFAAGVGSFEHCHFVETVVLVRETYAHGGPGPLPTCDTALLAVWAGMAVLGIAVQYGWSRRCAAAPKPEPVDGQDSSNLDSHQAGPDASCGTGGSSSIALLPTSRAALSRSHAPGRARHVPTLPPLSVSSHVNSTDEHGNTRSVRKYIRRRIAEVLAEARRLRLRLEDGSDSGSDEPAPHRTRARPTYRKLRTSTSASEGSSEDEGPPHARSPRRPKAGVSHV